uniref:hypothetical protein n=1 Tax=Aeromonas jandaei TaxID=650 RepID=UPI001E596B4A
YFDHFPSVIAKSKVIFLLLQDPSSVPFSNFRFEMDLNYFDQIDLFSFEISQRVLKQSCTTFQTLHSIHWKKFEVVQEIQK